ncbi:MAG: transketolase [Chloroflexi bacterium]|nr:transketolase [Chloroflexota bacterium]
MEPFSFDAVDALAVNTVRFLAVDAVEKAKSGHPGMPLGMALPAYILWTRFLKHDPADPHWPDRDRFVLSAGHGSMLLYALLHLSGYELPLEQRQAFRQWGSQTPGHPELGTTAGVETTTGPLGQGFGNGVGLALAERLLAERFNRPALPLVDHWVWGIVSDGDLMEGLSSEAGALAGHWGLGRLIYLYDDNGISIEGSTSLAWSEDVSARFRALGWQVLEADGLDPQAIYQALAEAQSQDERPTLVRCRTQIAYGSPNKAGSADAHGSPLGPEEAALTKQNLGWPLEPTFWVPTEVRDRFRSLRTRGEAARGEWEARWAAYGQAHPGAAALWQRTLARRLPPGWESALPQFPADVKGIATRAASGKVLQALAPLLPELVGGSADLAPSNQTTLKGYPAIQQGQFAGRNLHFGVREHAMGAILNGLALHGGWRPYGGTFLIFSDYMRPSIRLAALMELPVVYVFTHDSIFVGEDGPTHQPVEHLAALRAIPHLTVLRPGDANETAEAWRWALQAAHGPTALILSRQALPVLDRSVLAPAGGLQRGAYVLRDAPDPHLLLMASGSELPLALSTADRLAGAGVRARVVSFPSWELFEAQPADYRREVLPDHLPVRLALEAGVRQGWERYVGDEGDVICIQGRFGASAPYAVLAEQYGFTPQAAAARAQSLLERRR